MALDAQPARFFPADNDRFALHQGADIFESDRSFMHFDREHLRNRIDLMTGRHTADHGARPASILFKVIERQREDLIGC